MKYPNRLGVFYLTYLFMFNNYIHFVNLIVDRTSFKTTFSIDKNTKERKEEERERSKKRR